MDTSIGLPIAICSACIVSSIFFWCTYRYQVEPVEGRGSQDRLEAIRANEIIREMQLLNIDSSNKEDKVDIV
jgi:hypothetical protein